jgi:MinD superfamily P-loop ATPase
MSRVAELIGKFGIKSVCIINKADLNDDITQEIKRFLNNNKIPLIAELPYDLTFADAITAGKTIVEHDSGMISRIIRESWKKILKTV